MWHDMARLMGTTIVQTRTPLEVLRLGGAPSIIDYMSLDVEGSEMDILRAFPFDECKQIHVTTTCGRHV